MKNEQKIIIIKSIHTLIYLMMVAGIFYIIYAGITKTYNVWFYVSMALLVLESVVFLGNGKVCPLTSLAKKYGDPKGYVGDIFMPKKIADNTFLVFGSLYVIGVLILVLNLFGLR